MRHFGMMVWNWMVIQMIYKLLCAPSKPWWIKAQNSSSNTHSTRVKEWFKKYP